MSEAVVVNRRVVQIAGSVGSGGLIVHTNRWRNGETITIHHLDQDSNEGQTYYASVSEYRDEEGELVYAAVFPTLLPGNYKAIEPGYTTIGKNVTVFSGNVAQVSYA